jgi:ABC-type glutathione transport system ATPase component
VGFLFWKKKDKDVPTPEVEVVVPVVEEEKPKRTLFTKPKPKPEPVPEVIPEVISQPEPEVVTEVLPEPEKVEVVLPKRSFAKGIKSLFTRVKFDPENLDELEDVLIQADFGVDASEAIVTEVKVRAKKTGASTEAELKNILADLITENLERKDKELNLSSGQLPYVVLVVGVNGVGKTTLLKAILGQEKLTGGSIELNGKEIGRGSREIGYIPQHRTVDSSTPMRAIDMLRMGLDGHKFGLPFYSRSANKKVEHILGCVEAFDLAGKRVGELSGGELQRLRVGFFARLDFGGLFGRQIVRDVHIHANQKQHAGAP